METESLIMGAEREASKEMLKKCQDIIISAWVALPEGNYTPAQIENWLVNEMAPAISGNTVVWQNNAGWDFDIYAADISDPANPVDFPIVADGSSQENPDIDGNIVVWQDNRHKHWDIFGYNLTTGREFRITDDPHDQRNPAISGNLVVWQDNRDGWPNIYAVQLTGPNIARCLEAIPGDLNKDCRLDFTDFSLMAANWLECNLDQSCDLKLNNKQTPNEPLSAQSKTSSERTRSFQPGLKLRDRRRQESRPSKLNNAKRSLKH